MSNYRVRQVLALGAMPERQLRFLIALATWMSDHTRSVRVGFDKLIEDSGKSHNTVRTARRELESAGKLSSITGRGKGHLTVWVVLCLPETAGKGTSELDPLSGDPKGTNEVGTFTPVDNSPKGTNPGSQKVPTEAAKRYQPESADLRESDRGLNSRAKSSGFLSPGEPASGTSEDDERENGDFDDEDDPNPDQDPDVALLAAAAPGADRDDVEWAIASLYREQRDGRINSIRAYLRKIIANGDAQALIDQAATERRQARMDIAKYGDPFGDPAPPSPVQAVVISSEVMPSGDDARGELAALREVDSAATADEAAAVMRILRQRPNVRDPAAVLRAEIRDGNGYKLLEEARQLLAKGQAAGTWEPARASVVADDEHRLEPTGLGAGLAAFQARATEIRNGTPRPPQEAGDGQDDAAAPWLEVACLHCEAEPGKPCFNPGTRKPTGPHGVRIKTAERAAETETS